MEKPFTERKCYICKELKDASHFSRQGIDKKTGRYRWHYECNTCKNQQLKKLKQRSVELLGGKCMICDYSKCIEALEFHHRDMSIKEFSISSFTSWKMIQRELGKCDLLCSNCHREQHYLPNPQPLSKGDAITAI